MNIFEDSEWTDIQEVYNQLHEKWNVAKLVIENQGWYQSLFQSIKVLHLDYEGMMLLDEVPVELLFMPNKSNLNTIIFNQYWLTSQWGEKNLVQHIEKFEKQGKKSEYTKIDTT